mmetsp:Transcript_4706/g.17404  ORF Transcript_4706/g.17404 Transcript_4706/m.17404 type:complete len:244 (-) Transcript_4706:652-1383(-)
MPRTQSPTPFKSPRSIRVSTCASTALIMPSRVSAASSTANELCGPVSRFPLDAAGDAAPFLWYPLPPPLFRPNCPPARCRASLSHTAACRVISISMVFSMSSSSKTSSTAPKPFVRSPSSPSPSMSSSTSVSLPLPLSPPGSLMCSHVISTSTSSKCVVTPRNKASLNDLPISVSATLNAHRRYWVCIFLCALLCGTCRNKTVRNTLAASGTSVRIVVTEVTTPAVTVSAVRRAPGVESEAVP